LFKDLNKKAQKHLSEISKQLINIIPVKTGKVTFTVSQILSSHESLLNSIQNDFEKKKPYIYILKIMNNVDKSKLQNAFSEAKSNKKEDRAYARLNADHDHSQYLYVGSSHDIFKRIKEHLGIGAKSTYALNLSYWSQDFPSLEISLHYAQYADDTDSDLLQTLEDTLWIEKQPMFGRKGGR